MKILLACDGSEHSKAVLDETINSPWPSPSKYKVISVVETAYSNQPPTTKVLESARAVVDNAIAKLKEGKGQEEGIDGEVLQGHPKSEIIQYAEMWPCDLLIVGSRGLKGLKRLMLGSVSSAVLASVTCSVRIARASDPAKQSMKRILVALDDSGFSDHVVSRISSRPWADGTEFLCVTAVSTLTQYLGELQDSHEISALENLRTQQVEAAESRLSEIVATIRSQLPHTTATYQVLNGDPREAVVERGKEWGASLIVTGSKGKNWMDRVLIGSVSEAVARWSDCSVEVVKK